MRLSYLLPLILVLMAPQPAEAGVNAGVARRDVSVPELIGNQFVHDPLMARVLILDDGNHAVAIICLDMIAPWFAEIREQIKKELRVNTVLVNCSHTHLLTARREPQTVASGYRARYNRTCHNQAGSPHLESAVDRHTKITFVRPWPKIHA